MPEQVSAKLVLEDGSIFEGVSFGAGKSVAGEVVFNTGMVGYPESFTDPSYYGQILALTYPLIGNYGIPTRKRDGFGLLRCFESEKAQITGLVVANYSSEFSHWQAEQSLAEWLQKEGIPAITGIDCRAKNNIVRSLLQRNASVLQVPWDYDLFNGKFDFDAILVSNGPGNPKTMQATIETVKKSLEYGKPTFGICFGNQILALAAGADTYKLKYGHRSQNQPCQIVDTKKCFITSQNHGFAVDEKTLPQDWLPWFRNLNDNTNEGIRHKSKPFMSVQFHPEASPGPRDTEFLFDKFIEIVGEKTR